MLFDLGLDPAIVADKLGHADPAFTIRRYIGIRGMGERTWEARRMATVGDSTVSPAAPARTPATTAMEVGPHS